MLLLPFGCVPSYLAATVFSCENSKMRTCAVALRTYGLSLSFVHRAGGELMQLLCFILLTKRDKLQL